MAHADATAAIAGFRSGTDSRQRDVEAMKFLLISAMVLSIGCLILAVFPGHASQPVHQTEALPS